VFNEVVVLAVKGKQKPCANQQQQRGKPVKLGMHRIDLSVDILRL